MSGGDHMGGLALAIGVAMVAMVALPALILAVVARRFGLLVSGGVFVIGAGLGLLAVIATFYERVWSPPLAVVFEGASKHDVLFIVADPAGAEVQIDGADLPFVHRKVRLAVPPNGVVRVKDLTPLYGQELEAQRPGFVSAGSGSNEHGLVFDFGATPADWQSMGEELARRKQE